MVGRTVGTYDQDTESATICDDDWVTIVKDTASCECRQRSKSAVPDIRKRDPFLSFPLTVTCVSFPILSSQ